MTDEANYSLPNITDMNETHKPSTPESPRRSFYTFRLFFNVALPLHWQNTASALWLHCSCTSVAILCATKKNMQAVWNPSIQCFIFNAPCFFHFLHTILGPLTTKFFACEWCKNLKVFLSAQLFQELSPSENESVTFQTLGRENFFQKPAFWDQPRLHMGLQNCESHCSSMQLCKHGNLVSSNIAPSLMVATPTMSFKQLSLWNLSQWPQKNVAAVALMPIFPLKDYQQELKSKYLYRHPFCSFICICSQTTRRRLLCL